MGWLTRLSLGVLLWLLMIPTAPVAMASGLQIRTDLGPENSRRAHRRATRYIVLHTTEGGEAGSLRKLWKLGEAHYFVHRDGRVVRLIDRSRIATHAGDSLWEGRSNLDAVSLGIEVSGYHDDEPTRAQTGALRELLAQLQRLYGIEDEDVLTHSMVAFGQPNRFHPYRHRGRKRCAMSLARPDVRRELGLEGAPAFDPDVRARRLRVGDKELQRTLYQSKAATLRASAPPARRPRPVLASTAGLTPSPPTSTEATVEGGIISAERTAWSIAGRAYSSPTTLYVFPDGVAKAGDTIDRWADMPAGTRVLINGAVPTVASAVDSPQDEVGLLPVSNSIRARALIGEVAVATSQADPLPESLAPTAASTFSAETPTVETSATTPEAMVEGGIISTERTAWSIAGRAYSSPTTLYVFPDGTEQTGDTINFWADMPAGTRVVIGGAASTVSSTVDSPGSVDRK